MNLKRLLWLLVSIIVSYFAALLLFKDQGLVIILMASIFLHELGHWLALRMYGISASMIFIPLLGAGVKPDVAFSQMPFIKIVVTAFAGPIVNLVLVAVSLVLYAQGNEVIWLKSASLNASLAAWNLIPFWIFDGGRIINAIYSSMHETEEWMVKTAANVTTFVVVVILIIMGKFSIMHLLVLLGAQYESKKDNPADAYTWRAMTNRQERIVLVLFMTAIVTAIILNVLLPSWVAIDKD